MSLTVAAPSLCRQTLPDFYRIDSPPDSPIGLVALRSTASRSTRICLFLSPLVLPILPYGHSGNCSLKLPRIRSKYDPARGVKHHGGQHRRQRKGAGRTLETPGSTCDLISQGKVFHHSREIYAS